MRMTSASTLAPARGTRIWRYCIGSRSLAPRHRRIGDAVAVEVERFRIVEVIRHVEDRGIASNEEPKLQEERGLVVQERFPPVAWNELGEHNDDRSPWIAAVDSVDVLEEWWHERAVR